MKKTVGHPVLGDITVSRTRRATRIALSVRPDGSVRLSYPLFVTQRRAMQFLDAKLDWIASVREKLARKYPSEPVTQFRTTHHSLSLNPLSEGKAQANTVSVKIKNGVIAVSYPQNLPPESDEVQAAIEKGIVEALRAEAKELLPAMTERLAGRHGFRYGAVRVKASRSKWGSCTARNDINLSLFLALLPVHLAEYVVLHELCHTVHKNHSAAFHELLDRVCGDRSRELNRELKAYRPDIRQWKQRT